MAGHDDAGDLVRAALQRLRQGDAAPGPEEALVRTLAGWEHEHRTAVASLADATRERDPAAVDEEETTTALRLRIAELRGLREGFAKALALTLGHEAAARIEGEARLRN